MNPINVVFQEGEFSLLVLEGFFFNRKTLAAHGLFFFFLDYSIFLVVAIKKISLVTSGFCFVVEVFPVLAITSGNGVLPGHWRPRCKALFIKFRIPCRNPLPAICFFQTSRLLIMLNTQTDGSCY